MLVAPLTTQTRERMSPPQSHMGAELILNGSPCDIRLKNAAG